MPTRPIWPIVLLFLAGCPHGAEDPVGVSNESAPPPHATVAVVAKVDPGLPSDWRTTFAHLPPRISRGHGTGRWTMTVYGDSDGMDALSHAHDAKTGAHLVAEHPPLSKAAAASAKTASGAPATVLFIMEKRGAEWSYRVLDENGVVTVDPPECESCHDDAPHDHLYMLPPQ